MANHFVVPLLLFVTFQVIGDCLTFSVSETKTGIDTNWTCPSSDGFFAIPDYCGSDYIVCISGSPYISTCPGDNIFDPNLLTCVSPNSASCFPNFICPTPDGFFPIPGQCTNEYYVCISGDHYIAKCPGTAIFDPMTLTCTAAENASCAPRSKLIQ